jgi:hypothetical protein
LSLFSYATRRCSRWHLICMHVYFHLNIFIRACSLFYRTKSKGNVFFFTSLHLYVLQVAWLRSSEHKFFEYIHTRNPPYRNFSTPGAEIDVSTRNEFMKHKEFFYFFSFISFFNHVLSIDLIKKGKRKIPLKKKYNKTEWSLTSGISNSIELFFYFCEKVTM